MWLLKPKDFVLGSIENLLHGGYMDCQKARMEFAIAHAESVPNEDIIANAVQHIAEQSEIKFTGDELLRILALYPMQRAKLAIYGCESTEACDHLLDVVSNFIVNSRWPTFGDKIEVDVFIGRLKLAAKFMGYKIA